MRFDAEIHESSLRITYNDKSSSLQKLLEKDKSVTMHQRNIKIIATYKIKILRTFEERNNNYSLLRNKVLTRRRINSVRYGTEALSFLVPKTWDITKRDKGF